MDIKIFLCEYMYDFFIVCVSRGCFGGVFFVICLVDGIIRLWDFVFEFLFMDDVN